MRREDKVRYVSDLRDRLASADLIVRTRFQGIGVPGLNVTDETALRRDLHATGARYRVVKNTLLERAVAGTEIEALAQDLKGPIALAFSDGDPVAAAKVLTDFAKAHDVFVIEGGLLEGQEIGTSDIEALATLPGMDQLRSQFLALLEAVPRKLLGVLQAPARDLVGVLDARRRSLEDTGDAA